MELYELSNGNSEHLTPFLSPLNLKGEIFTCNGNIPANCQTWLQKLSNTINRDQEICLKYNLVKLCVNNGENSIGLRGLRIVKGKTLILTFKVSKSSLPNMPKNSLK